MAHPRRGRDGSRRDRGVVVTARDILPPGQAQRLEQALVFHVAGRRHHDVARLVPAPVERPQVGHA
jgi:hypothetical protein